VILWTIQTLPAWKILESKSHLRASHARVDPYFLPAYRWMCDQMRLRLGPPSPSARLPLWAWYQWESNERARPDLRCSGHLPAGESGALIELQIDDSAVLLSDFELWHYVLNYHYLPVSERDSRRFDALLADLGYRTPSEVPVSNREIQRAVRESWARVFDLRWSRRNIASVSAQKSIQATFWHLRLDQVRRVTIFRAR
jgi:hypothetical protein